MLSSLSGPSDDVRNLAALLASGAAMTPAAAFADNVDDVVNVLTEGISGAGAGVKAAVPLVQASASPMDSTLPFLLTLPRR